MSEKIILVFPGQGSQRVGMGLDLYRNHHIAREVFEEVDNTLNFKLSKIIFEGPEEDLTFTPNTQPALMAVSVAIVRVIEHELKKKISDFSEIAMGHSLGEYLALCSLNSISLEDTTSLLKIRGDSMQNSVEDIETSMVAVIGLDIIEVERILLENEPAEDDICEIANDNCPGQVILSGTKKGVETIAKKLKENGAKSIINLKVSAPFHCSLMRNVSLIMQQNLEPIKFEKFSANFISNVTADFEENVDRIKELLIEQVYSRVRWRESVIKSTKDNLKKIVEIGSGRVLSKMNKRINKDLEITNISSFKEIDSFFETYKEIL